MTGIQQIKDRILSDAEACAKEHMRSAGEKAEKILEAARMKAEERRTAIMEEAEREAADTGKRMIAFADMEIKKEELRVKREIVDRAFEMAMEKLCGLPPDEYCELLALMIVSAAGAEKAEILLSERDRSRLGEALMHRIDLIAQRTGKQADVGLSGQTLDIRGGCVLKMGNVEMNYSFEALIRSQREELEELACSMLNFR